MVEEAGVADVAAALPNVGEALAFLTTETVDVILLDLEMPGVDGLTGLPDLLAAGGGAKILVVSSSAAEGAVATVEALARGAADTLVKPGRSVTAGGFARALAEKLTRLCERTPSERSLSERALFKQAFVEQVRSEQPSSENVGRVVRRGAPENGVRREFDMIAIGASTGGIHAINGVLMRLPATFNIPIAITQHLPASFIPFFAGQLAGATGRACSVAVEHAALRDGMIVVAPGDAHLIGTSCAGGGAARMRLSRAPVANGNMPSVDPMFSSLAECFGPRLLAIVLSGMGRDGLDGARHVRAMGGTIIVQDQASSAVWGMPGVVAEAGLADAVLTPEAIGDFIASRMPS